MQTAEVAPAACAGAAASAAESPDEMNGLPITRASSRDGRWAYTLYDRNGEQPFIHALDTRDRRAFCIDLDDPALGGDDVSRLRLAVGAAGARLDVRRGRVVVARVDTATFRVSGPPQAGAGARPVDPAGPELLWPAIGTLLVLLALGARRWPRSRHTLPSAARKTS